VLCTVTNAANPVVGHEDEVRAGQSVTKQFAETRGRMKRAQRRNPAESVDRQMVLEVSLDELEHAIETRLIETAVAVRRSAARSGSREVCPKLLTFR
jgi:hypothetical protein